MHKPSYGPPMLAVLAYWVYVGMVWLGSLAADFINGWRRVDEDDENYDQVVISPSSRPQPSLAELQKVIDHSDDPNLLLITIDEDEEADDYWRRQSENDENRLNKQLGKSVIYN
jgi:hypothetical protein